jgi:hypothetical protein
MFNLDQFLNEIQPIKQKKNIFNTKTGAYPATAHLINKIQQMTQKRTYITRKHGINVRASHALPLRGLPPLQAMPVYRKSQANLFLLMPDENFVDFNLLRKRVRIKPYICHICFIDK